jgi:hypothetical protein
LLHANKRQERLLLIYGLPSWYSFGVWNLTSDNYRQYDRKGNYMEYETSLALHEMEEERKKLQKTTWHLISMAFELRELFSFG